jgi:hypothetical protein
MGLKWPLPEAGRLALRFLSHMPILRAWWDKYNFALSTTITELTIWCTFFIQSNITEHVNLTLAVGHRYFPPLQVFMVTGLLPVVTGL